MGSQGTYTPRLICAPRKPTAVGHEEEAAVTWGGLCHSPDTGGKQEVLHVDLL